jgi:hypothetical protein
MGLEFGKGAKVRLRVGCVEGGEPGRRDGGMQFVVEDVVEEGVGEVFEDLGDGVAGREGGGATEIGDRERCLLSRSCIGFRDGAGDERPRHSRTRSCVLGVWTASGVGGRGLSMSKVGVKDRMEGWGLRRLRGHEINGWWWEVGMFMLCKDDFLSCGAEPCCCVFGNLREPIDDVSLAGEVVFVLPRYCAAMAFNSGSSSILHFFPPTALSLSASSELFALPCL